MAGATLIVCTTCRRAGSAADAPRDEMRDGAALHARLAACPLPEGLRLRGVECLSACSNGCAVALSAPGRWTYVYGNLDPALHVPAILEGAARYAAAPDGIVPWRERPEVFRRQSLARIPPLDSVPPESAQQE